MDFYWKVVVLMAEAKILLFVASVMQSRRCVRVGLYVRGLKFEIFERKSSISELFLGCALRETLALSHTHTLAKARTTRSTTEHSMRSLPRQTHD